MHPPKIGVVAPLRDFRGNALMENGVGREKLEVFGVSIVYELSCVAVEVLVSSVLEEQGVLIPYWTGDFNARP